MAAPGDEFIVSVGVFNNTTGGSGPIRLEAQLGPGLSLVGPASVDLQIAEKKEGVGEFRAQGERGAGRRDADVHRAARRGRSAHRGKRQRAAGGRLSHAADARPRRRRRPRSRRSRAICISERRKVEAAVSTLPLVWGQGLTAYLDNYAYSCTEQLVSKGMSALILTSRPGVRHDSKPRRAQPLDATFSIAARPRRTTRAASACGRRRRTTAEFATVYAAHFLVEAQGSRPEDSAGGPRRRQRLADALRVDAGEHARRRTAARLRRLPARAAGHQAERRARRTSSRS